MLNDGVVSYPYLEITKLLLMFSQELVQIFLKVSWIARVGGN